ncbi:MAG TPA: phosphoribosyltransferase [Kofleriaceae bacterium]|nr:phosphoribosyltransferase [Kofleriaceae bacterium]
MMHFHDRRDAGQRLAQAFDGYRGDPSVVVLALPRGGVPVAYEIAKHLDAPLDVVVVRKLGVPGHEELAMGAIALGGIRIVDRDVVDRLRISRDALDSAAEQELAELDRRERAFRSGRPGVTLRSRTAILVDDGLATGSTMQAAIAAVRAREPARLIVAVPVAPPEACEAIAQRVDEVICLTLARHVFAIGQWYDDFAQTTDAEVRALLDARARALPPSPEVPGTAHHA